VPLITDEHRGMLDDLNDCGQLSDWEVEFVDSMLKRLDNIDSGDDLGFITDRQLEKLEQIYEERCA
jgi:hypothetical protein